jgi:hypothetical protein
MKYLTLINLILIILMVSFGFQTGGSPFSFKKNNQGIELLENGRHVLFYQKMPKSFDGKYVCCNYLHPLYNLKGDTLTQEFPADHQYHRGIFWAWHQMYINGKSVGDGWIMENIEQEVVNVQTKADNHSGQFKLNAVWKSPLFENKKPFLNEHTTITVYPLQNGIRKIDFAITLNALVPGLEIGGSDDEKGYGGLCARLKLPKDLAFTSVNGPVIPQLGQIKSGPWMDFSASFTGKNETNGVAILCHPKTPNYPAPWILRSETSMQNIVFPGRDRIKLDISKPVVLYYQMIVHNGNANSINLNELQSEYEATEVAK